MITGYHGHFWTTQRQVHTQTAPWQPGCIKTVSSSGEVIVIPLLFLQDTKERMAFCVDPVPRGEGTDEAKTNGYTSSRGQLHRLISTKHIVGDRDICEKKQEQK